LAKTPLCMQKFFWLWLTLVPLTAPAQVSDDFSDGDFTANPVWATNISDNWAIVSNQLRSNSNNASSTFYISTPSAKATPAQWEFLVNLQFATSGANYVDVYLISEQADLNSTTNDGYFVRIGGTPDEVSLFKLTNGMANYAINGVDGTISSSSNNLVRIKVIRNVANVWTLERDLTGASNYVLEGSVTDASVLTSSFFGIRITQSTASFHLKHFFDDFYAGDIIVDTTPPQLSSVTATSATTLSVVFNEKVQSVSANAVSNYQVNKGVGAPIMAAVQADEKTVLLTFANNFSNAQTSTLSVTNVADLLGNTISTATKDFFYFQAMPATEKDVIINEIFPDPSPIVGLPGFEFIELYNRSNKAFDLSGWTITDGSSIGTLTTFILQPNEYVILSPTAAVAEFSLVGNTLGVANFPSLNNDGDALVLKDNGGGIVDSINYQADWYKDEDKQQGGWTLELIDPQNSCGEEGNWIASEHDKGGTPGVQNSVNESKPDLTGPQLLSVTPTSPTELMLRFSEKLEKQLPTQASFLVTPSIEFVTVSFVDASLQKLKITVAESLTEGTLYSLQANPIYDCAGNVIQREFSKIVFALPQQADVGDIVINEILFNPQPNAVDFVEVYNSSSKFINLQNWSFANTDKQQLVTNNNLLIYPNSYQVFTSDASITKNGYPQGKEEYFFETDLPTMNDDEGSVSILDSSGNILDAVNYSEKWHSALLKNEEGVSLERVSANGQSNASTNWRSGVKATGFATPGYANANSHEAGIADEAVKVEPEIFEPIYGQPNFARIYYTFDQPGFIANAKIYDAQGREIKGIANNEVLAAEGFFVWDGDRDDGTKARIGYYTLWFEVFDTSGIVKTFRKRIVIAAKF
jgi:hypothetical protein